MAYVDPETVLSPKRNVRSVHVIHNTRSWSAALLDWNGRETIGIRWNGDEDEEGIGNPQSHGKPTWFVVPDELAQAVRDRAEELSSLGESGSLAGYREMANDRERESEAQQWSEGLIGDAAGQEG